MQSKPAYSKPEKRNRKGGKTAAISVLVIVAVLLVGVVGGMVYVGSRDTVFPNVYVSGISLGGMTESAAASILRSSGYEAGADNVRAEIGLPNDMSLVVTGEEAGMKPDATEAAERAYAVGRGTDIFTASYTYLKGVLGTKTELNAGDIGSPDVAVIRTKAQPLVSAINSNMIGSTYEMTETAIELHKGSGGVLASLDDVCNLVIDTLTRSLRDKTPAVAEYALPEDTDDSGVDFNALHASIYKEAVSAVYDPATFGATESVIGVTFDVSAARAKYAAGVTGELIRIPLIYTQPEVSTEELTALLFRDILSENKTYIDGSSNRLNNVKLAASFVNGTVLNPGDTFSYNGVVGKRTTEKGFLSAGAYVGGKTVQEIGGGICQVSSAIYDCTLYADLEVVERRNHQFIVTYLPLGNDATVNWGTTDYKFKNNTDYPIRIEIETDGRNMKTRIVGTKLTTEKIKINYVVLSTIAYSAIEVEDESIAPGTSKVDTSGANGYSVETYKYRYDENDNLISKDFIAKSVYNPHTRIVLVPVGTLTSPSPDVSPGTSPTPTPSPSDSPTPTPDDGTPTPTPTPDSTPTPTDTPTPSETPAAVTDEPSPNPTPAATPNDESI